MPPKSKPLSERIATKWKLCKTTGCWEWTASRTPFGYGKCSVGGKRGGWINAQRAAWLTWCGEIPVGQQVCHKCDNPPCINPAHLFLGTAADNMHDMYTKGRAAKKDHHGNKNPRFGAKLSPATKQAISQSLATRQYRITTPTGIVLTFNNLKAFAKANNLNEGHLSMLRRKLCKTCKGFTQFEYVD